MNHRQTNRVARTLEGALGEAKITEWGRSSGFTKRLRDVTPNRMCLTLLEAMGSGEVRTLADLQRSFQTMTERFVKYKPFHNQLAKPAFPVFMRGIFEHLVGCLAMRTLAPVPGHVLRRFKDIVVHDGSSLGLHEGLRADFPGRFSATCPAAVELHATMSVMGGSPLRVVLAPDTQPERPFLPPASELEKRLLLADRGYMDLSYCAAVDAAGGCFVIRFTKSANPVVVAGKRKNRRLPARALGKTLRACSEWLDGRDADLDVAFRSKGHEDQPMRLVLVWNASRQRHVILATNLPREVFSADHVQRLYRLRWQVEILFKEWKSHANLKTFCTRKAPIAEGLIWASLSAALLKRFLAHAAQAVSAGVEVSTQIAASALTRHMRALVEALLRGKAVVSPLRRLLRYLITACPRAHPSRDRTTGRLASGLRPTHVNARLATCVAKN